MPKTYPKPPCKPVGLLGWLGDIQCCTDRMIYEWCDIFRVDDKTRQQFSERYGDRLIGMTTFVNFWLCRDLPTAKKLDKYEQGSKQLKGPGNRIHSSKGMPWEDEDSTTLIDDLMEPGIRDIQDNVGVD